MSLSGKVSAESSEAAAVNQIELKQTVKGFGLLNTDMHHLVGLCTKLD